MNDIAVLVVSCDSYSDLWNPFFTFFRRFWPDCPYPLYLLSNYKNAPDPEVAVIKIGEDISWADNLQKGLKMIDEEFVLLWIDDLFLLKRVDNDAIISLCRKFIDIGGNQIRLNPTVKADAPFNDLFGVASRGTIYRASTVMSLWRKEVLFGLLNAGESAWAFEIHGTARSDTFDGFYSSWNDSFNVMNAVIKGKWRRKAYKKVSTFYQDGNISNRKIMTCWEEVVFFMKVVRSMGLSVLPARYRRKIKDYIVSGCYNYRTTERP